MSSTVRWDLAAAESVATSKVTIATAVTTVFDFGTPNDVNLAAAANYDPGDRIIIVLTASTTGTTDSLTWVIQDADDSAGSIGTPAAATLSAIAGALLATTGDDYSVFAVKLKPGRPWLRVSVTSSGATDTFVTHCTVLAVPSNA
jgi:hypothetical protein